jgi:hypothetical protein
MARVIKVVNADLLVFVGVKPGIGRAVRTLFPGHDSPMGKGVPIVSPRYPGMRDPIEAAAATCGRFDPEWS